MARLLDSVPPQEAWTRDTAVPPAASSRTRTLRAAQPALFVAITFIVVNALLAFFEPSVMRVAMYDFQFLPERIVDYEQAPHPDVIFMGSSIGLSGFDPGVAAQEIASRDHVRVHALNLSIAGDTMDLNYLVLKNIIRDSAKPRVIVYGLGEFEIEQGMQTLEANHPYAPLLMRPDDLALYGGDTVQDKVSFLLKTLCPIYRDHDLIRNALSIAFNPDDPAHRFYAPGPFHRDPPRDGFLALPANKHSPESENTNIRLWYGNNLQTYTFGSLGLQRLQAFLGLARARHIQVVLVNMPTTRAVLSMWKDPGAIQKYVALVRTVARANHVPLLDLYQNGYRVIGDRGFWDLHHLNQAGADTLTRMVSKQYLVRLFGAHARGNSA